MNLPEPETTNPPIPGKLTAKVIQFWGGLPIGQELAPICGSESVEEFRVYVMDKWKQYLPKPESG